jgi:hypothetical protein
MLHFYGTRIYCVRKSLPLVIPCQLHPVHILTHVNFTSLSLYISIPNLLNIEFFPVLLLRYRNRVAGSVVK